MYGRSKKLWGWWKVCEASPRWQKSTKQPEPAPASRHPAPTPTQQEGEEASLRRERDRESAIRRISRWQDMSHHLKPCGTIIPPSLWREKEGGGKCVCGGGGVTVGTEWVRGKVEGCAGVGGAAGCFTPGLFKETAQGMPLALLTKHFFFFSLSIAGCAQVKSSGSQSYPPQTPQPFEDASETFSLRHRGLFQSWCFKWTLQFCRGHRDREKERGYCGSEDGIVVECQTCIWANDASFTFFFKI